MKMDAPPTNFTARRIAVALAGYCAFINLYAPQAVLPLLSSEFGAGPAQISGIMTASTLAVAITAPFTGTVSDVLGRKRVIISAMALLAVPTVLASLAPTLSALVFWRFVQGLMLPPIFAVTIAYIGEEWPRHEATAAVGLYTSGSALGGFSGRFVTGILADLVGWRYGFDVLALMTLAGAGAVFVMLPREQKFVRSEGLLASTKQMLRHLRNPRLVATYAVGFGVLFNFIATFTYISFHLAAPPYNLSATALGTIFVVYLVGSAATPLAGVAVNHFGRRHFVTAILFIWMAGAMLTLASSLILIVAGMVCQAVSTGAVTTIAQAGRSSAVGLYVTSFYVGGSFGASFGGIAWTFGHWPACVALLISMLAIMATIVIVFWPRHNKPTPVQAVEPP
jgi:predicted MFS family arabinose efflux permease